jgi:hypothetical protein
MLLGSKEKNNGFEKRIEEGSRKGDPQESHQQDLADGRRRAEVR